MFRVNGLFGHIQLNNFKTLVLIVAFLALSVAGTVGPLQLVLHGLGVTPGGEHWDVIRQSIEEPVFSYGAGATFKQVGDSVGIDKPAPKPGVVDPAKPRAADAPLDLSQIPGLNQPGAYFLFASPWVQSLWVLGFAFVYLLGATWWNSQFIRYATRAKPLRRSSHPDLYNIVENLAISAGIPCPAIEVVPSPQLNAYATGLTPGTARMGFTTGLLERLDASEIEAVAAHELTHILYRDMRLMAVTKSCVDLVLTGPRRYADAFRRQPTFILPVLVMVATGALHPMFYLGMLGVLAGCAVLAYLCKALVMQSREFVADAGAIELTKAPGALISALLKVAGHEYRVEGSPFAQAMMIVGPIEGWFSTHPSLDERIAAIRRYGGVAPEAEVRTFGRRQARSHAPPPPAVPRVRRVAGLAGFDPSVLPSAEEARSAPTTMSAFSNFTALPSRPSFGQRASFSSRTSVIESRFTPDRSAPPAIARPAKAWLNTPSLPAEPADEPEEDHEESMFERWVISGRLHRIASNVNGAANSARRTVSYVYVLFLVAVMFFGFVMTAVPRFFL